VAFVAFVHSSGVLVVRRIMSGALRRHAVRHQAKQC
jgi:hypothetical protein